MPARSLPALAVGLNFGHFKGYFQRKIRVFRRVCPFILFFGCFLKGIFNVKFEFCVGVDRTLRGYL